jgi:hypothetical protein
MCCEACPFSFSDVAEQAQNYGCLPGAHEIRIIKRDTGKNWMCHDDETKPCAGYVADAAERGIDYKTGGQATLTEFDKGTYNALLRDDRLIGS